MRGAGLVPSTQPADTDADARRSRFIHHAVRGCAGQHTHKGGADENTYTRLVQFRGEVSADLVDLRSEHANGKRGAEAEAAVGENAKKLCGKEESEGWGMWEVSERATRSL